MKKKQEIKFNQTKKLKGKKPYKKYPSVTIQGIIEITRSGSAYLIPNDRENYPEDIFISPQNTANALNGDKISARIFSKRDGKRKEGEVQEVLERKKTEFVGTLQLSKGFGFLHPDDPRIHVDIFIPEEKIAGAKQGQKVLVKMIEWEKWKNNPSGEVSEILGNPGENETEIHSILAEFGLPYSFPRHVELDADKISRKIPDLEIAQRRDFRDIPTCTIDPVDAKDFDDALSFKILENGNFEVGVHIADVTHYVRPGSEIEKEATRRATSVYLVDRVIPMLPEILSNNICSLRPNEDKLCFSAVFEMNHHARILHKWFGKTVINSNRRFTYEDVQKIIDKEENNSASDPNAKGEYLTPAGYEGEGENSFVKELLVLNTLAQTLRRERIKKGAISFDKIEVKFRLDEKANPVGVYFKKQENSHKLIEEFMLLANRSVAEFCGKPHGIAHNASSGKDKGKSAKLPFVYRVHDLPNEEKIGVFSLFIRKFGYKITTTNRKNISRELNDVLEGVKGKPEENMIETLAVRTMMKAIYTTKNIGHYGLAFDHYTHFTSPIRRYPDMMVHRLLEKHLELYGQAGKSGAWEQSPQFNKAKAWWAFEPKQTNGGKASPASEAELEDACKHSSKMEKLAEEAERASVKYKQVQFLVDRVGEQFEGLISGVTEWGLFVELVENKCEGMIRLRDLQRDFFIFDEDNYRVVGKKTGKIFQLGDKVNVIVKRADLVKKQLDFEML